MVIPANAGSVFRRRHEPSHETPHPDNRFSVASPWTASWQSHRIAPTFKSKDCPRARAAGLAGLSTHSTLQSSHAEKFCRAVGRQMHHRVGARLGDLRYRAPGGEIDGRFDIEYLIRQGPPGQSITVPWQGAEGGHLRSVARVSPDQQASGIGMRFVPGCWRRPCDAGWAAI